MIYTINERVTFYRNRIGKNQEEVARLMNLKLSTYSQMERDGNISAERLVKLAEIFDISVDELLYGDISEEEEPLEKDNTFKQSPTVIPLPPPFEVTNVEKTILTIIRNLSKKDRDSVIEYIENMK